MSPGSTLPGRVFYLGSDAALRTALEAALDLGIVSATASAPRSGDLVLLDARAPASGLVGGNAFSACRTWHQSSGPRVVMLLDSEDAQGGAIARFCGAEACISVVGSAPSGDLEAVRRLLTGGGKRSKVDELLERFERKLESDPGKRDLGLRRMVHSSASGSLMAQLSDPETGLWDGAFASYKIDEELKRAIRMRQPLTLVLLDIGVEEADLPQDGKSRGLFFAEVASVFLNESRDIDVLARFTPTVFLFLLPGTGIEGGGIVARRMVDGLRTRTPIAGITLDPRAGLVTAPAPGIEHREAFLLKAEACLSRARDGAGGSGVCSALE